MKRNCNNMLVPKHKEEIEMLLSQGIQEFSKYMKLIDRSKQNHHRDMKKNN